MKQTASALGVAVSQNGTVSLFIARVTLGALIGTLLLAAAFFSGSSASSRLAEQKTGDLVPLAAGTLTLRLGGQFVAAPSDTFTVKRQLFTGSTNCGGCQASNCANGGAVTYLTGINSGAGDSTTTLTAADSVLLTPFPNTERGAQLFGWNPPGGLTIDFIPNSLNTICVHGFDNITQILPAQSSPAIQTLDATCTNPQFIFAPGDTVCARVAGSAGTVGTPWKINVAGGSINECSAFYPQPLANVTAETQTATFVLPLNNAAIPAACTPGGTTDIRGNWRAILQDQGNNIRGQSNFRIRNSGSAAVQLSVNKSRNSSPSGDVPGGNVAYGIFLQNGGPDFATNVSMTESVPAGLTFQSFTQTSGNPVFNCTAPIAGTITCTATGLAPDTGVGFIMNAQVPAGTANGTMIANTASATNTATELHPLDNTSTATITVSTTGCQLQCPATMTVAATGPSGAVVNYVVTKVPAACNSGSIQCNPASGSTFPVGTTNVGCVGIQQGDCQFIVKVTAQDADLEITKTHPANFFQGQTTGSEFNLTVSNGGAAATSGTVTVVDDMPPGLTPTAMSGTGWTCTLGTLTCTRSDALPSGGSYPPINVKVGVARYLFGNVQNKATVSGGGQTVTTNDTVTDFVQIVPPPPVINPTASESAISGRITTGGSVPISGAVVRLSGTQTRVTMTDANGNYRFDNVETNGFYTVAPSRANYGFSPANRSFSQIGNQTDASFEATFLGASTSAIDTTEYFVRQQYLDFLGREPDEGGLAYWSDQINQCNSDPACISQRRIDVSAAFFASTEFQETGSYIYGLYAGTLGRTPGFSEFMPDRSQVLGGSALDQAKTAFAKSFVQRTEFSNRYPQGMTREEFVDAILQTMQQRSGIVTASLRDSLMSDYDVGGRSLVVRHAAEAGDFVAAEYNKAFVLMEYFGYLRREIDQGGYDFWLDVLNSGAAGNYRGMVCAFLTSTEYQHRFGSVVAHSNAECGQ